MSQKESTNLQKEKKKLESVTLNKSTGKVVNMKEKPKEPEPLKEEKILDKNIDEDEIVDEEFIEKSLNDEDPDFELEPENNPHIDDFTPSAEGGLPPISSIQISEEDRLRVLVSQLQIQNLELESKVIEQKYSRKVDELNKIIADYKVRYKVPDEWALHGPTGTFNKRQS